MDTRNKRKYSPLQARLCDDYSVMSALASFGILLFLICGSASAQFFSLPSTSRIGSGLSAIASADFNGDGKADIAVLNSIDDTVSILLSSGNGSFTVAPGSPIHVGRVPGSLVIADFNTDSIMDLAIANRESNDVSIFFGDNRGNFATAPGSPFAVGIGPQSIALGRQAPNNNLALYIANRVSGTVSVLVVDKQGNFSQAPGTPVFVGRGPASVVTGNFAASEYPFTDIAVANTGDNTVTVLLQNAASGTFAPAPGSPFAVDRTPLSLTGVDIDHDGKQDLIIMSATDPFSNALRGSSEGSFTVLSSFSLPTATQPNGIAVADFDLDGCPDLVAVLPDENGFAVFLGKRTGGFSVLRSTTFPAGRNPGAIAVADFDGDGRPDVATVNPNEETISVLLSQSVVVTPAKIELRIGSGAAMVKVTPPAYPGSDITGGTGQKWLSVLPSPSGEAGLLAVTANLQGVTPLTSHSGEVIFSAPGLFSGRLQVSASASNPSNTFTLQSGSPFPGFGNGSPINTTKFVTGDFDGDSYPDVVVTNTVASGGTSHERLTIYFGPAFTRTSSFDFPIAGSGALVVGDFNRDGAPDVAESYFDGTLSVFLSDGRGGFTADSPRRYVIGTQLLAIATADLNHDGKLDLVIGSYANSITVLLGLGDGTFSNASPASPYSVPDRVTCISISDFNSDGNSDFVFGTSQSIQILLGNGAGGFSPAPPIASSNMSTNQIAVLDLNNDGIQDLAVATLGVAFPGAVQSFIGDGFGGFRLATNIFPSTFVGYTVVAADLNGDGIPDLASGNFSVTTVYTFNGHGGGVLSSFAVSGIQLAVADFNRDGRADLAVLSSGVSILLGTVANTSTSLDFTGPFSVGRPEGSPLGLRATVNGNGLFLPPTGTVRFYDNGSFLAEAPLDASGQATLNGVGVLALGGHKLDGTYTGDAADISSTAPSLQATIVPGPAFNLTAIAGSNQRAVVGSYYSVPFQVLITDAFNVPVPNTTITFSAPASGAGGSLSGMSATSNDSGVAISYSTSVNYNAGAYLVSASGTSFSTSIPLTPLFTLTNVAQTVPFPYAVSVSPSSGFGTSQKFTAIFSDNAGAAALNRRLILINSSLNATGACFIQADATGIYLVNDAGNALQPATSLSNSQCTVNGANSNVVNAGNNSTVTLAIAFAPGFAGAKTIYMYTEDSDGNTGFQTRGAFTVIASPPTAVSVTPSSGSSSSQTFSATYSDAAGATFLTRRLFLINSVLNGAGACYVQADPSGIYLVNDAGSGLVGPVGSGTVSNTQCTLNGTGSSLTNSGTDSNLTVSLIFRPAFAGAKNIYMYTENLSGNNSGFQTRGMYAVPFATPSADSVTPSSGLGTTQTFTTVYSDASGAGFLNRRLFLVNSVLSGSTACFVQTDPSGIYLVADAGNSLLGPVTAGNSFSNSQCTLNGTGTRSANSGATSTVTLAISFKPAFAGAKNIYLYAEDSSGNNSGFQTRGTFTVSSAVPTADSVSPASGSGTSQTFAAVYSDASGAGAFNRRLFLINSALNGAGACFVQADPTGLYLVTDAGNALIGPVLPDGSATNNQCTLNGTGSSIANSGNTSTVTASITFKAAFAGAKNIYLYAEDNLGNNSGFQTRGTFAISGTPSAPTVTSVTPSSGSGANRTFTMVYSDAAGNSNLSRRLFLVNATLNGAGGCFVEVNPSGIYLADDADSALIGPLFTNSSLTNNQCTLNGSGASVSYSATSTTVVLPITFKPAFGGSRNIYMYADDTSGNNSGFQLMGTITTQ